MRRIAIGLLVFVLASMFGPPLAARVFGWGPDPSLRPPPGKAVDIGAGRTVNVVEVGSGPPVVLVHGLPSNAYDWADMPRKLAQRGYRVIAYDRLGYGYSSRPAGTPDHYTLDSNARDLAALLDKLGLARAALVGWSYGGGVAQRLAEDTPQRVSHLILLAAVGPAQPKGTDPLSQALATPLGKPILSWVASIPPLSRRLTHDSLVQVFARAEAIPPQWTDYTRAMLSLPGTLDSFVWEEQRGDYRSLRPATLQVPTLILQGTADASVPPLVADDLHRSIRGSQLVSISEGSHMLPVTHPDSIAERIDAFVRTNR